MADPNFWEGPTDPADTTPRIRWGTPAPSAPSGFDFSTPTPSAPATPPAPDPTPTPNVSGSPDDRGTHRDVSLDVRQTGTPATPDLATMSRQALASILNPAAMRAREAEIRAEMDAEQGETRKATDLLTQRQEKRDRMEDAIMQQMREFRSGIEEAQQGRTETLATLKQKLQAAPAPPDLKVRPWLDPEGKNALSVIAQSLGMLATGIGGIVQGAPKTALSQFREAADLWRRDEIDAANSKFQEFQATIQTIRENNVTALAEYDRADKQYGANLLAKQAALTTSLDALGLHDASTAAAMLPYKLGMEQHQHNIQALDKLDASVARWGTVAARLTTATDFAKNFTSGAKARGYAVATRMQAQATTDPEEKARLLATADALDKGADRIEQDKIQTMEALGRAQGGVRFATQGLKTAQDKLGMVELLTDRVEALDKAYRTLEKGHKLPKNFSTLAEYRAAVERKLFGTWTDDETRAAGVILQFFSEVNVTAARTILSDVSRFKGMYGQFTEHPMMPYPAWAGTDSEHKGILGQWTDMLLTAHRRYTREEKMYRETIGGRIGQGPGGESTPPPDDGTDDE